MHPFLNKNLLFVKEHVGLFKAANNYDILDPESKELLITCREEKLGFFTKMLRFTDYKRMTPFRLEINSASGEKIMTIRRGTTFWASKVQVLDENEEVIGIFKQKIFSFGGRFNVCDAQENVMCTLKGKWTGWDFKFIKDNIEFAHVTKKWAGLGKELFTTADNYILSIDESVPENHPIRQLILASVMCIDMVLKE